MIHKSKNGEEHSLICMIKVIANFCLLLDNKKIHIKFYLIGRIISTNISKDKILTKKILLIFKVYCNKISGKNVSKKEEVHFIHSFNIGVTMLNQLQSIPKILNGSIFLDIIVFCIHF